MFNVSTLQTIVAAHMHADTTGKTWSAAVVIDLIKVACKPMQWSFHA